MDELSKKVLLWDRVPLEHLPRYETSDEPVSYVFSPMTGNIVRAHGEEILVPLTKNDVNWDEVLIKMLEKSDRTMTTRETKLTPTAETIDNHDLLLEVDSYFADMNVLCGQVVVHPDNSKEMPLFDVYETDLCPVDRVYFLAPPQFLGVLATKDFPNEPRQTGMSVINSQFVFGVDIKAG
jgi:hypothetical protein